MVHFSECSTAAANCNTRTQIEMRDGTVEHFPDVVHAVAQLVAGRADDCVDALAVHGHRQDGTFLLKADPLGRALEAVRYPRQDSCLDHLKKEFWEILNFHPKSHNKFG